MFFRQLLNRETSSYTYAISDHANRYAILIDPTWEQVERDAELLEGSGLEPLFVLLTDTDPSRLKAARHLAERTGARVLSRLGRDGGADARVEGGDILEFGTSTIEVLDTPGYHHDGVSYLIGQRVFTGGSLCVRHCGNGGAGPVDPGKLYDSVVDVLFQLQDETFVYPSHHRGGATRTTIGAERRYNPDVAGHDRGAFVQRYAVPRREHSAQSTQRAAQ